VTSEHHVWAVEGLVVRGEQRGRLIGYPTANVETPTGVRLPADGVYAGLASGPPGSGLYRAAAISVGTNPTFDGQHRTVAFASQVYRDASADGRELDRIRQQICDHLLQALRVA